VELLSFYSFIKNCMGVIRSRGLMGELDRVCNMHGDMRN
jgi:hypothetical protein